MTPQISKQIAEICSKHLQDLITEIEPVAQVARVHFVIASVPVSVDDDNVNFEGMYLFDTFAGSPEMLKYVIEGIKLAIANPDLRVNYKKVN